MRKCIFSKSYETSYSSYGRGLSPDQDPIDPPSQISFARGPFMYVLRLFRDSTLRRSVYRSDYHEFSARHLRDSCLTSVLRARSREDHVPFPHSRCSDETTNRCDFSAPATIVAARLHVEDPPRPPFAYMNALSPAGPLTQYAADCEAVAAKYRHTLS